MLRKIFSHARKSNIHARLIGNLMKHRRRRTTSSLQHRIQLQEKCTKKGEKKIEGQL